MLISLGAHNETNDLINMMDRNVASLYPNYDIECTILASASMDKHNFKEFFQKQEERHAVISVAETYLTRNKDMLSAFLRKRVGCVVAAFKGGKQTMEDLIYAMRKVKNNFVIKLDGRRPKLDDMVSSNYPIMWSDKSFRYKGQRSLFVDMFCPKEDKSKNVIIRIPVTETSQVKCPPYLEGQKLGLGHIYHGRKKIINGKAVFGDNYVRFFEYASKKFKFDPWFKLGRVTYFPKNESWGGIMREVSKLHHIF